MLPHQNPIHASLLPIPATFPAHLIQVRGFFCECFVTKFRFYSEELLAPRPTHKLEDHPLSAVRYCLFNIFAATLHNAA
jgi:hypothetical protein